MTTSPNKMSDNTVPKRCDLCGKFRRLSELTGMAGEYGEEWVECDWCMSGVDYENKYGHKRGEQL